jgi:phage tail tape-measure protein
MRSRRSQKASPDCHATFPIVDPLPHRGVASEEHTMGDVKKDHSIGEGTGAVAGGITGAAVGSAAGPIGTVVGAIVGGAVGAKAGDSVAEAINPTDYDRHF